MPEITEPNFSFDISPQEDECRYLLLKVIDQAVRDYLSLKGSEVPIEKYYFETAEDMLFDDEYLMDYAGGHKPLKDILDYIDIDIVWFREHIASLSKADFISSKRKRHGAKRRSSSAKSKSIPSRSHRKRK